MKQPLFRPVAAFVLTAAAAFAQTPAAPAAAAPTGKLQFEVASIKLAGPIDPVAIAAGKRKIGTSVDGTRAELNMLALGDLIQYAYKLKAGQLTLLDWMKDPMSTPRYDIVAKMPEGATKDDLPVLVQGLLAERFGLVMRKETKEGQVTALVVGKGGPKLKASVKEDPAAPKDEKGVINMGGASMRQSGNTVEMRVKDQPGKMKMTMQDGKMHYSMTEVKMDRFVEMLSQFTGGPVANQTGLTGEYDVEFEMSMADMLAIAQKAGVAVPPEAARALTGGGGNPNNPAEAASDPSAGGGIQRSLQQLGLALEKSKGPVDHYIIEKLEKNPTEN
jgi:uncharacterized protein (TIGR03435 family)